MRFPIRRRRSRVPLIAGLVLAALALPCMAELRIVRHTLTPAAEAAGGAFHLRGTLGQPAVNRADAAGLRLQGGFHRATTAGERIFTDGFETPTASSTTEHTVTPEDPT